MSGRAVNKDASPCPRVLPLGRQLVAIVLTALLIVIPIGCRLQAGIGDAPAGVSTWRDLRVLFSSVAVNARLFDISPKASAKAGGDTGLLPIRLGTFLADSTIGNVTATLVVSLPLAVFRNAAWPRAPPSGASTIALI